MINTKERLLEFLSNWKNPFGDATFQLNDKICKKTPLHKIFCSFNASDASNGKQLREKGKTIISNGNLNKSRKLSFEKLFSMNKRKLSELDSNLQNPKYFNNKISRISSQIKNDQTFPNYQFLEKDEKSNQSVEKENINCINALVTEKVLKNSEKIKISIPNDCPGPITNTEKLKFAKTSKKEVFLLKSKVREKIFNKVFSRCEENDFFNGNKSNIGEGVLRCAVCCKIFVNAPNV